MTKANPLSNQEHSSASNEKKPETLLEKDPRAELGLKSPVPKTPKEEKQLADQAKTQGPKATRFDGNPNPEASDSSILSPKDDTPMKLEKTESSEPNTG